MIRSPELTRVSRTALRLLPLLCSLLPLQGALAAWAPKTPPLATPWTSQVSPANALPEYPRPQMVRSDWQNLNGEWQFASATAGQTPPFGQNLAESVLVPFPIESALSGIKRYHERMWYRRTFTVPAAWNGRRINLHFGAVDWQATVYVNRQLVGTHQGGFDGFSFDITGNLNGGTNEIIVGVYDPTEAGGQPVGKQRNNPSGIFYTAASGIWQTVWLEPTPSARITRLDMTPDVAGSALRLTVRGTGLSGQTVEAIAFNGTTQVGSATGSVDGEIRIPVPTPKLWSPESPFLYDLRVSLKSGATTVDQVTSYFGMRTVGLKLVAGALRPVLNGQFVFQIGTLDQGYWPDGIFTAPTDEALKFDIQKHKDLGYNLLRKHIKVEPQRWFYWADKLGILVWQDMPLMDLRTPSTAARAQFELELKEMIDEHRSSTSVIAWVVQNEGWGQYDQARLASLVKGWDPSRLVDNMSGINCCGAVDGGNGDLADWHVYVGPASPVPSATRAAVLGEFGGLGLRVAGHEWSPGNGFGYEMVANGAELTSRYVSLMTGLRNLMTKPGLSAAVYTEITDVENEANGMFTYDRAILKVDLNTVRAAHNDLIAASRQLNSMGPLPAGQYRSLQVTTPGFTHRYARHFESLGTTEAVTSASNGTLKQDATFKITVGLADAACYSFESRNFPGSYLRHSGSRIRRDARDGTALFDQDATFCARAGLDGSANISLESKNKPGAYLRHRNSELWVDALENTTSFRQDATWAIAAPWWQSTANVPSGNYQSFQVTSAGYTNRYLRHIDSVANTEVVDGASSATLKQDATFQLVPGLAESSCYSFESRNFPGHYLRHNSNRVRKDARDGSALFDQDATFCAHPGLSGTGVSFESFNFPGRYLRHFGGEVWTAAGYGGTWDSAAGFNADASWNIVGPWAP
ncbi:Glycosyl hydrolases family 2, TIM barrel domain [Stigmatella aurantiaca]|uniref:Glycosyl hydrolases family 2, TIM barrel domain n=1 Tax=Stigmatella aurantiaca TaxID=41 RepID=A0A1H7XPH7_STIAU|nr:AbfB domain-containing protein [Stigmatella aurantiaca]SEM35533.1 Glycosyl hydrolases family 2, TIM barrel domain [Stigmatella aurantiaca]